MIANETLEEVKRKKSSCLFLKVNYEKAYDSVRLDFLYYMLDRLGFGGKWIRWIKACLEYTSVSILVNGSPTEEFKPGKGLRQGDPLAPFLFLIVAEGMAGLVRQAVAKDLLQSVEVGSKRVKVNMLHFTDETLFFCKVCPQNIMVIKSILYGFELASGLRVYFSKSKIGGVGISQSQLQHYSSVLHCEITNVPFKYLGLEVGENQWRVRFRDNVVAKIRQRLDRWKEKFLSMAGRVCLLRSVISNIPLFYMSFFKMTLSVVLSIKKIQNFLWGLGKDGKKVAWVAWEKVCNSREKGGLGIKDIRLFNDALLGKWIWRIQSVEMWKEIIESKYDDWKELRGAVSNSKEFLRDRHVWFISCCISFIFCCLGWVLLTLVFGQ